MLRARELDGGAFSRSAFIAINKTAVAAGAGDAAEVDGAWVDRIGDANAAGGIAKSAKLVIVYTAQMNGGNTLTFGVQFRDASSIAGAGAQDYGDAIAATVAATGDSGSSTTTDTFEVDIDLAAARQFIQAQITPNLSAGSVDAVEWAAVIMFYGEGRQPISAAEVVANTEHTT